LQPILPPSGRILAVPAHSLWVCHGNQPAGPASEPFTQRLPPPVLRLLRAVLTQVNLLHSLHRICLVWRFVGTQTNYTWEAECEAAFMAIGAHDVVEGYFEDDHRLDQAPVAEIG